MTVSEERLRVSTEWAVSGRVRVRRQVTSQTRSIEVTVRREELVVETDPLESGIAESGIGESDLAGTDSAGTDAAMVGESGPSREPVVFLLREEVPQITMGSRAYEQVTLSVVVAVTEETVDSQLRREQADVAVISDAGPDAPPPPSGS